MTDTPTNDDNRLLFAGLSVLELHEADACEPARRAVALVSRLVSEASCSRALGSSIR